MIKPSRKSRCFFDEMYQADNTITLKFEAKHSLFNFSLPTN
jgi:hypothetical protein